MVSWKVLYVKSGCEFAVQKQFVVMGIGHYLPTLVEQRQWSDRILYKNIPAFPSYIFVHQDEKCRNKVFFAKGVSHYIRIENQDAIIPDDQIKLIKESIPFIRRPQKISVYKKGDLVIINSGLLYGYSGTICESKNKKQVVVALSGIRQNLLVELSVSALAFGR